MNKYSSANFNCFSFYSTHLFAFKIVWYAMLALQNAYVFLYVSISLIPFGRFKNNR